MTRRPLTLACLCIFLICATGARPSLARAPDADLPALVDDSFALPPPVELVADRPVADDPAVPAGVSGPDNKLTVLYVAVAAAGGFVAGVFVGCLVCFAVYYT